MSAIGKIWAQRILAESKTFFDVPSKLQSEVRQILLDMGYIIGEDGKAVPIEE